MAENSKIEWTDHTFNPWIGCTKVSPGCANCYAEVWAKRSGLVEWGPKGERRRTSEANWRQPRKWDRQAAAEGRRAKVFCASLSDVFERHPSIPSTWRIALWGLIEETPHLDWLLLTKRPENIAACLPGDWGTGWPNVWLGTTVENQEQADERIPHLLATPAAVRFLSCEPLLGEVDISEWLFGREKPCAECPQDVDCECGWMGRHTLEGEAALHWVICGGESGPKARPMHPDWARSLRDQCAAADVPYLFKQWGEWLPASDIPSEIQESLELQNRVGYEGEEHNLMPLYRVGKKAAGRMLDGVEHSAFPEVRHG